MRNISKFEKEKLLHLLECSEEELNNLTEKNVITILRQILKPRGYVIASKEKYMKGHKFITYTVKQKEVIEYIPITSNKPEETITKSKKPIIITFN